jgi:hypothetical protein
MQDDFVFEFQLGTRQIFSCAGILKNLDLPPNSVFSSSVDLLPVFDRLVYFS